MSLNYKNRNEILNFIGPKYGNRFSENHLNSLKGDLLQTQFGQNVYGHNIIESYGQAKDIDRVELHVYTEAGQYIGSDHSVTNWSLDVNKDKLRVVTVDFHNDIRRLNLTNGKFKIVYNFNRNYVGSYESDNKLFIKDISNSRRELKVSLVNPDDNHALNQMKRFATIVVNNRYNLVSSYDPNAEQKQIEMNMNFGNNNIFKIINMKMVNHAEVILRLYEPLPNQFDLDDRFWLSSELLRPYTDSIYLIPNEIPKTGNYIKPANFNIEVDYWKSSETELKSWEDILGSNAVTSQRLIDQYFSGSLQGVNINIDYSRFENFVHFSSAEERVRNFKYKLDLIEFYDNELATFDNYTGSLGSNRTNIETLRRNVIGGFDGFEKHLYYNYSSSIFSHASQSAEYEPFPKQNSDYPYNLFSTTASISEGWYNNILETATEYDRGNDSSLRRTIPEHIVEDANNQSYVLFMDMIGQHYDIIWSYIEHFKDIYNRDEHPKRGTSNELLYQIAKSYGWTLTHGKQVEDLWKYTFGVDENNNMISSGSGQGQSLSGRERVYEVWKRIVNNLPYILKTKGTSRSIKALISCYGIPESVISIREYGGPRTDNFSSSVDYTRYENLLEVGNNSYFTIPWKSVKGTGNYPQGIEISFKPLSTNVYEYSGKQTLFQLGDGNNAKVIVEFEATSSDKEKANINLLVSGSSGYVSASINDVFLYNGSYTNLVVKRETNTNTDSIPQVYTLAVKSNKYQKVFLDETATVTVSSSNVNNSWTTDNIFYGGYGNNFSNSNGFSGSIYGVRYWNVALGDAQIANHTLSLRAYNSNNISSSYDDLALRVDFNDGGIDYSATSSIASEHPNKSNTTFNDDTTPLSASLINIDNSNRNAQTIDYRVDGVSLGINSMYSNKVRIESSSLNGNLSIDKRSELGAFDTYPNDSNRMDVVFSPQTIINEDIIESYGSFKIDDYIGDPREMDKTRYNQLEKLAETYWKKYLRPNDFVSYIRVFQEYDFSVFDQIRQTLLSRTNKVLGLLIEPNILERSKVKMLKTAESFNIGKDIDLGKSSSLDIETTYKSNLRADISNDLLDNIEARRRNISSTTIPVKNTLTVSSSYQNYCAIIDNLQVTALYQRFNFVKSGSTWISQSNEKEIYSPTGSRVLGYVTNKWNKRTLKFFSSSLSESLDLPYSTSYEDSTIEARHNLPIAHQRLKFLGCRVEVDSINTDSSTTPDGGPVVTITKVTGNRLVTQEPDENGNLEII